MGPVAKDKHPGFAPCPLCGQYSHTLGNDKLADAFMHFQSMYSHRGDGIPTQYSFDEKTRDAAQVLMAAARTALPTPPKPEGGADGINAAWSSDTSWWAARKIARFGLAERRIVEPGLVASVPTPLGLAVRQILTEQDDAAGS